MSVVNLGKSRARLEDFDDSNGGEELIEERRRCPFRRGHTSPDSLPPLPLLFFLPFLHYLGNQFLPRSSRLSTLV
jgi:hypothetical protein